MNPTLRLLCAVAFLALPLLAQKPDPAPKLQTTRVEISVAWEGERPKLEPFRLPPGYDRFAPDASSFCQGCIDKKQLVNETLLIDKKGGIRNVAVSFPRLKGKFDKKAKAVVANEHCRFSPHVQFAPNDRKVWITNTDPLGHNARFVDHAGNSVANVSVAPRNGKVEGPLLRRSGIYTVHCTLHPWMKGYVISTRNPFHGVTNAAGSATIMNVPIGKTAFLIAWHETLGTTGIRVQGKPGGVVRIRLTQKDFAKPKKR